MTSGTYRSDLRTHLTLTLFLLVTMVKANGMTSHSHPSMSVSAPYLTYVCPEGATVQLLCSQQGKHADHMVKHAWHFTPHMNDNCHERLHPRRGGGHGNHSRGLPPPGVKYAAGKDSFWVELQNVTRADQGRYCCLTLEFEHGTLLSTRPHSHVVLTVTPRKDTPGKLECNHWGAPPPAVTVTAGLATAACIMAILSLPLILILVYRQKQSTHSSRRATELVRMDSEALGHENPVFLGGSPQAKVRTVSQIMTRQSSETGRHLLSDPGTPLSPGTYGEVFFPSNDPIPESPDFMQV